MSTSSSIAAAPAGVRSLWDRQLSHYPDNARRSAYLGITVLATIVLYYELYVQGSVSTKIIAHYHFSFTAFVVVLIVGNAFGAFASLFAGLADRWGRANLVVIGLLLTGLLIEFAMPNASSKGEYLVFFALVSMVEGVALVATPALIRDFSPQVGRGVAMGFWTMGPVLGSMVVTEVSSHTLSSHPNWQYQFHLCGIVGLIVWAITFVFLRELSPRLRDQLMVSLRDRALIEARAAGLDTEKLLHGHWRQMLRRDIVIPGLGISIFLMLYYVAVAFFVVYFATVFGYTATRANNLSNWYWIANAIALIVCGVLSDRLLVRKPFMILGTLISLVGVGLFASAATDPHTGYHTFAAYFILIAGGGGIAYVAWMAAFTETVEKHNPAATATGLAVWGWTVRIVVTVSYAVLTLVVPATSTLVDQGPRVQSIAARYPAQITTLNQIDPATRAALKSSPLAQAKAVSELSGVPVSTVAQLAAISKTYPGQVRVLQTVDPATLSTLSAQPTNPRATVRALSELAGVPAASVARVVTLSKALKSQLATASAIDPATQQTLALQRTNKAAQAKAVAEIASRFGISPAQAGARLLALSKVPLGDLLLLKTTGPKVQSAAAQLKSLAKVPPADLAVLSSSGAKAAAATRRLQAVAAVPPADLAYLAAHGANVVKAQRDSPGQWQTWWWICFAAQVLFLPCVFLLSGFWSPRRAREADHEHEAMVERELARLRAESGGVAGTA